MGSLEALRSRPRRTDMEAGTGTMDACMSFLDLFALAGFGSKLKS